MQKLEKKIKGNKNMNTKKEMVGKTEVGFEEKIMSKVTSKEIAIKPKIYFVAGSILSVFGFVGLTVVASFAFNLIFFTLRRHGPMAALRFNELLLSFPVWILIMAFFATVIGIMLLKRYEFSYKKNFLLIILSFIIAVILAGVLIDRSGINEIGLKNNKTRGFYQMLEKGDDFIRIKPNGIKKGKGGIYYKNGR